MALAVTQRDIIGFKQRVDRLTAKAKAVIDKNRDTVNTVVSTMEVSASSFIFGLAQGKFGGVLLRGIPMDLIFGVAFHVLAFTGKAGRGGEHLHAFGDGALASFFNSMGRNIGYSIQTEADRRRIADYATKRKRVYGTLADGRYSFGMGETGGAALADEELARMVAAGRR